MPSKTSSPPTAESYGAVVRRLASAQKPAGRGAPAYSIYVNRPLGRRIAAAAYLRGLTPNAVTALSATATFTAIAVLALAPAAWATGLVVAVLLVVGYALDSADGQLARLRGGGSATGEWLDHVVDAAKTGTLHLAVAVALHRALPVDLHGWLLVPLGFTAVATTAFAVFILNDLLKAARRRTDTTSVIRGGSTPLRALAGLPTDYGVLCLVFVLLGAPAVFLGVYTFLFVANAGYLALALPKWFRDTREW